MRKRKSSEPPEEENTPSPGDWRTGEAQVIRVVRISNIVWLCLGLVIGQSVRVNMFILKFLSWSGCICGGPWTTLLEEKLYGYR